MNKKTTEQFKTFYQQWEQYLKARFGEKDMYKLSQKFWQEEVNKCKKEAISENELLGLINIRNADSHCSSLLEIEPYAVTLLRRLVNTFCKKAKDIAVPASKIYKINPQTKIQELITNMNDGLYTHVPVIQGKVFCGVFSENTLLKIIVSRKWREDLSIRDITDILKDTSGSDGHRFLPEDASFYDVYQLFQEYIDRGERLGVVFLTRNGQRVGDLKGLITAWDLHKGLEQNQ